MTISVTTQWDGNDAAIIVAGEADLSSAPSVDAALEAAIAAANAGHVEVDLSQVTFLDSSGISALLRGRRMAEDNGVAFKVVGAHGLVLDVLELTGVWSHLSGQTG
jgi:anti-sigma B factor antagonist